MIWNEDAPIHGENPDAEIADYVDRYVTVGGIDRYEPSDIASENEELQTLINYQTHRHSGTCKKFNSPGACLFGFPQPPMRHTAIIYPLEDDDPNLELHKANWKKIAAVLDDLLPCLTFDDFLNFIELEEEAYILALRSSLKNKDLCLRRNPSEVRINNYNLTGLKPWRPNMDIQFILDPYACAMYIVSYISKSQRGLSNLLSNEIE